MQAHAKVYNIKFSLRLPAELMAQLVRALLRCVDIARIVGSCPAPVKVFFFLLQRFTLVVSPSGRATGAGWPGYHRAAYIETVRALVQI